MLDTRGACTQIAFVAVQFYKEKGSSPFTKLHRQSQIDPSRIPYDSLVASCDVCAVLGVSTSEEVVERSEPVLVKPASSSRKRRCSGANQMFFAQCLFVNMLNEF